ncbi:MAG: type II toxin-antitoxin system VapC family toxin [Candidatus Hydrogenedentes bacterium]|nr:type II toxin-antitoxin system VapC family toxin [Candidatus Hydrogenedentota bacterium]
MVLVDTDVLVDILRGRSDAAETLDHISSTDSLATSIVTRMELVSGCRNRDELGEVGRLLRRFEVIPVNEAVSESAAGLLEEYRLSHGLLIPDAFIAATAMHHDAALLTRNIKHFAYLSELKLHVKSERA